MSKTTMTVSLDKEVKKSLNDYAKSIGTNSSNLLNMIIIQYIKKPKHPFLDLELEPFSEEEMEDLMKSKSIQKNMKKMEKLLANV